MEQIEDDDGLVSEMRALIHFCEVTDNKELREIVKQRLKILSDIPVENEWSMYIVDQPILTKDYSWLFSTNIINMLKDYFENPDKSNQLLSITYNVDFKRVSQEITRFFKLSPLERKLILET